MVHFNDPSCPRHQQNRKGFMPANLRARIRGKHRFRVGSGRSEVGRPHGRGTTGRHRSGRWLQEGKVHKNRIRSRQAPDRDRPEEIGPICGIRCRTMQSFGITQPSNALRAILTPVFAPLWSVIRYICFSSYAILFVSSRRCGQGLSLGAPPVHVLCPSNTACHRHRADSSGPSAAPIVSSAWRHLRTPQISPLTTAPG